jgi:putative membrane protein
MIVKRNFDPRKVAVYVWKDILLAVATATLAYGAVAGFGLAVLAWPFAPLGLLGTALAIFLAFRANTSFLRWGEAAQSWAVIAGASRTFGRLTVTFVDAHRHTPQFQAVPAAAFKREMLYRQLAWVHALRLHLRGQQAWDELRSLLTDDDFAALSHQHNKPAFLLLQHGRQIYDAMAAGILQGFDSFQLEGQLAVLATQQAVCERIKQIPVPRQYDYFTRVFVRLFVVLAPFFLIDLFASAGVAWLVIPFCGVLAFLFTTIERTGAVNEEPFENRITDVPMSAYCRDLERDLRALLDETDLPPRLTPQDGYLW